MTELEVFNRREIKYLLNQQQVDLLLKIIPEYMNYDSHNLNGQVYHIHNLYIDSKNNELIRNSIEKPVYKEKIRLRSYGVASKNDTVYFEIKKKFDGVVNKRRTPILLQEAYDYIYNSKIPVESKLNTQVFDEVDFIFKRYDLEPKVFISYDRLAFFEKNNSDFRLTLDKNITTRRDNLELEKESFGESLLPENTWVLEAKAFKAFPLWFVKFLSENKIYNESFSKYGKEFQKFLSIKNNF